MNTTGILVLAAVGIGGYYLYQNAKKAGGATAGSRATAANPQALLAAQDALHAAQLAKDTEDQILAFERSSGKTSFVGFKQVAGIGRSGAGLGAIARGGLRYNPLVGTFVLDKPCGC